MGLYHSNFRFRNRTEAYTISGVEILSLTGESEKLEEQITEIFENFRMPIYQYLLSVFGNAAEAEGITQDAFLQLYKTVRKGETISNVRFWLFRVARNLAINRKKHNQFIAPLDAEAFDKIENNFTEKGLSPEEILLEREKYERLMKRMKRLSLNERQCLYLRTEGFKYREIAEIMGVRTPTIGEFLRRGIKKLSDQNND